MSNDRLSTKAGVCQFELLTLNSMRRMSKGAIDCTLMPVNVHGYIKRAIETLRHSNEVYFGVDECTVILLNQR